MTQGQVMAAKVVIAKSIPDLKSLSIPATTRSRSSGA
jgi:hypothetical protein